MFHIGASRPGGLGELPSCDPGRGGASFSRGVQCPLYHRVIGPVGVLYALVGVSREPRPCRWLGRGFSFPILGTCRRRRKGKRRSSFLSG